MNYWTYRTSSKTRKILLDYVLNDQSGIREKSPQISKTNWPDQCRNSDSDQKFYQLFYDHYYQGYSKFLSKKIRKKFHLTNLWYQVYERNSGDNHGFHIHDDSSISNVLYLELKSKKLITEFFYCGKLFQPRVREGDTLIFDSYLRHRSVPNDTLNRKVIISFNVKVEV